MKQSIAKDAGPVRVRGERASKRSIRNANQIPKRRLYQLDNICFNSQISARSIAPDLLLIQASSKAIEQGRKLVVNSGAYPTGYKKSVEISSSKSFR